MLSFVHLLLCATLPSVLSTPLARDNPDCLPTNNIGASLVNQSRDGNFTSCTYSSEATPCTYFLGGDFSSGSSNCPSPSIIGSGTKTAITVMDFLCLALNLNASAGADGSQLERATNISDAVIQCEYFDGNVCKYSRVDGSRQDGVPNVCPSSIDPDKNKETDLDCDELDLQQSLLIGSSVTVTGNLACAYGDGALCKYSTNGTLSFGDGLCPPVVTSSTSCTPPTTGNHVHCPPADNNNSSLIYTSPVQNGAVVCGYWAGAWCAYSATDGKLGIKDSACPQPNGTVATASSTGGGAYAGAVAAAVADKALLADNDSGSAEDSDNKNGPVKPAIIALLALNGFLVIAVLTFGGMWIVRRGKVSGSRARLGTRYETVESVSVPLTLGREDKYYDAPSGSRR